MYGTAIERESDWDWRGFYILPPKYWKQRYNEKGQNVSKGCHREKSDPYDIYYQSFHRFVDHTIGGKINNIEILFIDSPICISGFGKDVIKDKECFLSASLIENSLECGRSAARSSYDFEGNRYRKKMYQSIRILGEGIELATEGKITYPRPESDFLMRVRTGRVDERKVYNAISNRIKRLANLQKHTVLPNTFDFDTINHLLSLSERISEVRYEN